PAPAAVAAPAPAAVAAPAPAAVAAPAAAAAPVPVSEPVSEPAPAPAAALEPDRRPRITSQGYVTWIWPRPSTKGIFLGYVRHGDSLPLRSTEPVRGPGCPGGFVPVEPRGFVCLDRTATLSPAARFVEVAGATRGGPGSFPFRYAISNGAPMYNRVPTRAEQARFEAKFGRAGKWQRLPKSLSAHEDLATAEPIPAADPLPAFLDGNQPINTDRIGLVRQDIPLGSMLSFTRAFEAEGRTWLLSADLTLVPADRVRPFRPSAFHGTRLGGEVKLPSAWIRKQPRPRYRLGPSGDVAGADGAFPARSFVQLTGKRVEQGGAAYLETRDQHADGGAVYIAEADATVVERRAELPNGVGDKQKWIHVRVTQGTLVAYEGRTPVYATLMSPGAGGGSVTGRDPVQDSTTPRGTYDVTFKDRAATMSPEKGENRTFWIADVPHTQYFNPPFALHAAYWHERFGEPTSAGCVNVSPIDAEVLFQWSDPPVPEGWQGATGAGAKENGPTTAIVVHR
ncbi:MAG: L,D-transpeptidase, partial [Polyangiaceae bacterium]|nr:L,D-transpeptidase [Polyangiaceae bacterium]